MWNCLKYSVYVDILFVFWFEWFSVSLGNQQAQNDIWNNPQLVDLKQEIDAVVADIKAEKVELKKALKEGKDTLVEFLKQSIAKLEARLQSKEQERRELTQSLLGR